MEVPSILDGCVTPAIPEVAEVLETNTSEKDDYFMKVSKGRHGHEAPRGEFESTSAIYKITSDFCPKPIAWGTFAGDLESHFYICKFYEFAGGVPNPTSFREKLARLNSCHTSPNGKFGFDCVTYNGNLPQRNSWPDNWKALFTNGLRHILKSREERAGPNSELGMLMPPLFDKVIPRLLRPLDSDGHSIIPSLMNSETGALGEISSRKSISRHATPAHIPKPEPREGYGDRNTLYSLYVGLQ
ncbi:Fructosamine kinase-domain-containing protein [Hypoxylon sp. FL1284]|nr:Fructosamine kinase-domain-containing protein [Hypoxylon sp. FL1284]